MSTSFTPLIAATLAFVCGHFVLSAAPIRGALIRHLGRVAFLGTYSVYAITTFIWMNMAYTRAPFDDLWGDPGWTRWVAGPGHAGGIPAVRRGGHDGKSGCRGF